MLDIVNALTLKKGRLLNQKEAVEKAARAKIADIENDVQEIDRALATIKSAIDAISCPRCEGTGETWQVDAAGQREHRTCPACRGTGIKAEVRGVVFMEDQS